MKEIDCPVQNGFTRDELQGYFARSLGWLAADQFDDVVRAVKTLGRSELKAFFKDKYDRVLLEPEWNELTWAVRTAKLEALGSEKRQSDNDSVKDSANRRPDATQPEPQKER